MALEEAVPEDAVWLNAAMAGGLFRVIKAGDCLVCMLLANQSRWFHAFEKRTF
ncbi:hypothetical protein NBRC3257_0738 [Gluconobacter thailandicus NBRC 3257]|uniref:Uncharacterized protein n=1 Tax=Gluconobacter thailandicus NBRC 3257 TaxID=1381097 RepID=A0ABQ0IU44_GLUTH|nr:hypothetical protein NBRC3255_1755 [Gluconobacter thailandicus NBRC 3255]GAD25739.1 hypothetical protein NBRC3257_0738 [Gluconobacter thailandicus NBRC 3257]